MDLYYNSDNSAFAVLVSHGFGAGWSTWNESELAYDKRVVEWYLNHNTPSYCKKLIQTGLFGDTPESEEHKEAKNFFVTLGYKCPYFGGYENIHIEWIPTGAKWRIEECGGSEHIVYKADQKWNCFT